MVLFTKILPELVSGRGTMRSMVEGRRVSAFHQFMRHYAEK